MPNESGLRYNKGKTPYRLISTWALKSLAEVLQLGAEKYAPRNWEKGLSWDECSDSLLRHLNAWRMGEDRDPETGLFHLAHVFCNAMFLLHMQLLGTGTDDRPHHLYEKTEPRKETPIGDTTTQALSGGLAAIGIRASTIRALLDARDGALGYTVEYGRLPDLQAYVQPETGRE